MFVSFAAAALAVAITAPPKPTAADVASLRVRVERIASKFPMSTATLGVSVVEADNGAVLYERDAGKEFAPASNFKLLTAATALSYLGPRFRFRTDVLSRGAIADGQLTGDLIVAGGGDPILTRADLASAVKAVRAAGILRIAGAVAIDDTLFDEQRFGSGWAWDDFPYYYQPPIQALSVDEGLAHVTVAPGEAVGNPIRASIEPNGGAMTARSVAVTSRAGGINDVDCFRSPGNTQIVIVGHYPMALKPFTFGCAVDDSAAYAASTFVQMLRDAGVVVGAKPSGAAPRAGERDIADASAAPAPIDARYPEAKVLWTHESPSLADILARMMPPSDNFIAEHLFKMLPVVALGQRGTFDGGARVERKFLASLGLDPRSLDNGDGSGLSQGDRITPHDLSTILEWETRSKNGKTFINALPLAGINGTVRKRMRGSDAVGRVRAKSGYIWHASTLSGYALTKRHGLIVFCVMFNDANGDLQPFLASEDKIVETIVDWP